MKPNSVTTYPFQGDSHFSVPVGMLIPMGDGGYYKAFIDENLPPNAHQVYDIVTAAENYDFAIAEYVKRPVDVLPETIDVLLIYPDAEEQLYQTLAVQVILKKVSGMTQAPAPTSDTRNVLPFDKWIIE